MLGHCGVTGGRPDHQTAVVGLLDFRRQAGHVDEHRGDLDGLAHQVDEVRAATKVFRALTLTAVDRVGGVGGACVCDLDHAPCPAYTSKIASTIPLWAPQRHRFPLIRSRSSS